MRLSYHDRNIFMHLELINNPLCLLFFPCLRGFSAIEAQSAPLSPFSSTIYCLFSVCSSADASPPGLLHGDLAFCSQGVPHQISNTYFNVKRWKSLSTGILWVLIKIWDETSAAELGLLFLPSACNHGLWNGTEFLLHCARWVHGAAETWTSCSQPVLGPFLLMCWVACSSLGHQLPLLCSMTTTRDDHSPMMPKGSRNIWAHKSNGYVQQYCEGWGGPTGSRGGSEHATAKEKSWKHPWGLILFPGATVPCDEQKLPALWK